MILGFNKLKCCKVFILSFLILFSSVSFAANEDRNVSQDEIIKKSIKWLQNFSKIEKEKRQYLVEKFTKGKRGICTGISSLWLHSKWLQIKQQGPNDKCGPVTRMENKEWFQSTIRLIVEWDEKSSLDEEAVADIDTFIENIEYFHDANKYLSAANYGDLDESLYDTNKGPIKKKYSIASLFTLGQLKQLLKTKNIIQNNALILIHSHDHATALFKEGMYYYYFDPNSSAGEVQSTSTDDIAKFIFDANFGTAIMLGKPVCYAKPSPLAFCMFSFDDVTAEYPPQKDVLDKIKPALNPVEGYAYEYSGLMIATNSNSFESVQYLLKKGANPNTVSITGQTALSLAAYYGNRDVVEVLLKDSRINLNVANKNGWAALMYAASRGHRDVVEVFLKDSRADPNAVDNNGRTALSHAADNDHCDVVEALLADSRVNPNMVDQNGLTALMWAAYEGHRDVVEALLKDSRVDPNAVNNQSQTDALGYAVAKDHRDVVEALLKDSRVKPNAVDNNGQTALIYATYKGHRDVVEALLKDSRVEPNAVDNNGQTALMWAVLKGYSDIVEVLLADARIDVNKKNNFGSTASVLASKHGYHDIAQKILLRR